MDAEWTSRRNREAAIEEDAQEAERRKRRGKLHLLLAASCIVGILTGAHLSHFSQPAIPEIPIARAIQGDWELKSIDGSQIGPKVESVILSQYVRFQGGTLHGATHIRADSDAGTTAMPFPDESVTEVKAPVGGNDLLVVWDGTYKVLPNQLIEMHIGKAKYLIKVHADPQKRTLEMDQDAILTYKGASCYEAATINPDDRIAQSRP